MSHIPSEAEEKLAAIEQAILDYPLPIEVQVNKFPVDSVDRVPRGYVETETTYEKVLDAENGMVTKKITLYYT